MREAYIYGLYSTDNPNEIRYIGVSVAPEKRLKSHLSCLTSEREYNYNPHKGNWIRSIFSTDDRIEYKVLAVFDSEHEAYASEDSFIEKYKENNRLVNLALGGRGGCITPVDKLEKTQAKRNATFATKEYREKISKIHKDRFNAPKAREDRSRLSTEMWKNSDYVEKHKAGLIKAQKELDYLKRAAEARGTTEWRKAAKVRGIQQFSSVESRLEASNYAKKGWANLSPEQRKERAHKALMTRKYNMAKKNSLVLHLDVKAIERQD